MSVPAVDYDEAVCDKGVERRRAMRRRSERCGIQHVDVDGALPELLQHAAARLTKRAFEWCLARMSFAAWQRTSGCTPATEWAFATKGFACTTDHRPDVHKGEEPITAAERPPQSPRGLFDRARREPLPGYSLYDPSNIHFNGLDVAVVNLRRNGKRCVPTNAGQLAQIIGPATLSDQSGCFPDPTGATRVAETSPGLDHVA